MFRQQWWVGMGYHHFEPGEDGFPHPGQVIKYFRLLKKKDNGKSWTQADLAKALCVTEKAVRAMENYNVGLDSLSRRRVLTEMLKIPPALLGIITLDELAKQQVKDGHNPSFAALPAKEIIPITKMSASSIDITEYQYALQTYWETNHAQTAQNLLHEILERIDTLYRVLPGTVDKQETQVIELLCRYHQLVAGIIRDQQHFEGAIAHLNRAVTLAKKIEHKDLLGAALFRRGGTYSDNGEIILAIRDYEEARSLESYFGPQLKSAILQEAGHTHAELAQTNSDITQALRFIDQAGNIVRQGTINHDEHYLKRDVERYHINRGSTLITIGWYKDALDELTLVDKTLTPGMRRRRAYCDILCAQAYFGRKHYPIAANIAEEALIVVKDIQSNVNFERIGKLYAQLKSSPYGNNPDVARLGFLLTSP